MRGNGAVTKVVYKGSDNDFIIFVESAEIVKKWKTDKTIPLVDVVNGFKIFTNNKQGAQGVLDTASKGALEEAFGTSKEDDAIQQILEKGEAQEGEASERQGHKNDSIGGTVAH